MKLRTSLLLGALALIFTLLFALVASARTPPSPSLPPDHTQVQAALQRAPLLFIQNAGQFAPQAHFQVRGAAGGGTLWLAEDALWLTVVERSSSSQLPSPHAWGEGGDNSPLPRCGRGARGESVHLKLSFLGANPHPRLEPFQRLETHVSYFLGNDPTKWYPDVPVWGGVRYVGLYPGIDLEVGGDLRSLRLVTGPGADLGQVRLRVEGAEEVRVEGDRLHLTTALGPVTLPPLLAEDDTLLQPILAEGAIAWARQPFDRFVRFLNL